MDIRRQWMDNFFLLICINYVLLVINRHIFHYQLGCQIKKKTCITIKNHNDDECFRWCHLAYLFPVLKNTERISKYKERKEKVNYDGIKFPVEIKDIPKIEKMNNVKFNLFYVSENKFEIFPRYISEKICHKT